MVDLYWFRICNAAFSWRSSAIGEAVSAKQVQFSHDDEAVEAAQQFSHSELLFS